MHINGWTLVLQAFNVLVLLWLLQRWLFKPVLALLDERAAAEARRRQQQEDTRAALEAQRTALASAQTSLAAQRSSLLAEAQQQAQQEREAVLAQARTEAQRLLDEARQHAHQEREAATAQWLEAAATLAADMALRLLQTSPAAQQAAQAELLAELLAQVETASVEERARWLPAEEVGERAEPTPLPTPTLRTACPLPETERAALAQRLSAWLGQPLDLRSEVDATLLCGAELHWPHAVQARHWAQDLRAWRAALAAAPAQVASPGATAGTISPKASA